jgi:hypothetical protein
MATISPSFQMLDSGVELVTWGPCAAGDVCVPIDRTSGIMAYMAQSDRSVDIDGNFNGATVVIQGTNQWPDTGKFKPLRDPAGNSLSFSTSDIRQILEIAAAIVPVISGGTGLTSLTVAVLMVRRPQF